MPISSRRCARTGAARKEELVKSRSRRQALKQYRMQP
jgi:hypothetical protein